MRSEISQTQEDKQLYDLNYMWNKKKSRQTNRIRALPGFEGWEKWGDVGQRVETFSCKMNKFWGSDI